MESAAAKNDPREGAKGIVMNDLPSEEGYAGRRRMYRKRQRAAAMQIARALTNHLIIIGGEIVRRRDLPQNTLPPCLHGRAAPTSAHVEITVAKPQ